MGSLPSSSKDPASEGVIQNRQVEKFLRRSIAESRETVNLLLLGTGNSGKSTILKQFQLLQDKTALDPKTYKALVSENIITGLRQLFRGALSKNMPKIQLDIAKVATMLAISEAVECEDDDELPALWREVLFQEEKVFVHELCKRMWEMEGIKEAFARKSEMCCEVSIDYFMKEENFERIRKMDYCPSVDDMLHTRKRTTGVVWFDFLFTDGNRKTPAKLIDVGGQKNERRKWISHFDNTFLLLYVVSLGDFDTMCMENPGKNRMHDSLEVFESVMSYEFNEDVIFLIIFNKADILRDKIENKKIDIRTCFPEYEGQGSYYECCDYIKKKYEALYLKHKPTKRRKSLYNMRTVATNRNLIKQLYKLCSDVVLQGNVDSNFS